MRCESLRNAVSDARFILLCLKFKRIVSEVKSATTGMSFVLINLLNLKRWSWI